MTRISLALLCGAAALGFVPAAQAADLYSNNSSPMPGFVNMGGSGGWDGAYVGGFAGYGWGTVTDADGGVINLPGDELDLSGWLIGANLGANFTVSDGFVVGAVGDVAWSGINGYDANSDLDYDINWTASLRGISIMEIPPAPALPVRTAVTNHSAYLPPVIHFFVPFTM